MRFCLHRLFGLTLAFLLQAVSGPATAQEAVSILTYNLENLFDTRDDADKSDETFLPLKAKQGDGHDQLCAGLARDAWRKKCRRLNWDERALSGKIRALASVIEQAGYPDVLVFQEVENSAVLKQLADALDRGYDRRLLVEGRDTRGIDQAILSRLPLLRRPKLHKRRNLPKRGVLEATLALPDGEPLTVFAVHLSAGYHPVQRRLDSLLLLRRILAATGGLMVAAGDFNLDREDLASLQVQRVLHQWVQVQDFCRGFCQGTYYSGLEGEWHWLDRALLPHRMAPQGPACWHLDPGSVRVVFEAPEQVTKSGYPRPYSVHSGRGASDHLPLLFRLIKRC